MKPYLNAYAQSALRVLAPFYIHIHVMLEELENDSIEDSARRIREVLEQGKQGTTDVE